MLDVVAARDEEADWVQATLVCTFLFVLSRRPSAPDQGRWAAFSHHASTEPWMDGCAVGVPVTRSGGIAR
jgi:hypothetical protein